MMWDNLKKFLNRPYSNADMTAFDWFLLFGLFLAITVAWGLILRHINGVLGE